MCAPESPRLKLVVAGIWASAFLLAACNRSPDTAASPPAAAAPPGAPAPAATQPDPAAAQAALAAQTQAAQTWEPSALDELLAPIALYPDALVGQILAASKNAQEVLDAGNWLIDNPNVKGKELDAATEKLGFTPPVRSLVQFPSVIDQMCQQLDWTREVGKAFTADQQGVLDAIQRLRTQAAAVGNLKTSPQQKVETKTEEGKEVITVAPADPKVVYVPQYDPQVVYVTPPTTVVQAAPATTTVIQEDDDDTGNMIAAGLMGFTAGIVLNEAFDDHDDYYPHYGGGGYPPPYYPYRPPYGAGYQPATGYNRPAHYGNTNVNINNNYYNRATNNARAVNRNTGVNTNDVRGRTEYTGGQNRTAAGVNSNEYRGGANARNDATQRAGSTNEYRGAANTRNDATQRAGSTNEYRGGENARNDANQRAGSNEYRGGTDAARNDASQRAAANEYRGNTERNPTNSAADRTGAERQAANAAGSSAHQPRADRGFDSGGTAPARDFSNPTPAARPSTSSSSGALSNVNRGGKERAASERGHQSAGKSAGKSGGGGRRR